MAQQQPSRSAFVPHDLRQPLRTRADGPLAGLTIAVKDMYAIAGERCGAGNPDWLAAQAPAARHCPAVDKLLAAGGTIMGKTVCDEFFYSVTGMNAHYGTPLNPRAPGRIPGGSSSGSASAVSAGACDLALGSDTGGSSRVPAANCGIYGIRVSHGRMDLSGVASMAPSFDAGGWFAATPGLFALAGPVLLDGWDARADITIAGFRLLDYALSLAAPDTAALCRRFIQQAAPVLGRPSSTDFDMAAIEAWREAFRQAQAFEAWESFGAFISARKPQLGPGVAERMQAAATITAEQAGQARARLREAARLIEAATEGRQVLVLPTSPDIAPLLSESGPALDDYRTRSMRLSCLASISGLPQVTIPIGTVRGAPFGLSFLGWRHGEEALLALARRLAPYVGLSDSRA